MLEPLTFHFNRNSIIHLMKITFILILITVLTSCNKTSKNPNIILIMTDDQGWYDVGFNGNTEIKTPWLDSLASNGVIFDRFYSASAVCSPTRASLITGRNPLRMNIPYANSGHMKREEITIPEILKKQGYTTGHFGKWHLGTLTKNELDANRGGKEQFISDYTLPSEHGYDYFFCTESKVPTFDPMLYPTSFDDGESKHYGWRAIKNNDSTNSYGTSYWKNSGQKETANLKGDDSRIIMDRVVPFIKKANQKKQPFFTTIWFHTPHLPVVSDSLHRSYYGGMDLAKQIYYGTLTALDEQIGRLWDVLERSGIDEETIIFFCSDNGPENKTPGSAGVFRNRKRSLYEGGVRVPAFVIWKNTIEGGKRIDFPSVTSDYLPTILDILNIEYSNDRPIDGTSLFNAIKGIDKQRTKPIGFICAPKISWVTNQYKLIGNIKGGEFELYDLINDKSEKKDISKTHPELVNKLKSDLKIWEKSVENSNAGSDYN